MNCPNCGTSNLDNATICVNCGRPLSGAAAPPPAQPPPQSTSYTPPPPQRPPSYAPAPAAQIPNYLIHSIVVTLCCCLPLGIVAIVFAAQVNQKLAAGDVAGAQEASNKAKLFCWIGFGIGLVAMVIWMLAGGVAFMQGIREGMANR